MNPMNANPPRFWMLNLTLPGPWGRWLTALLIFATLLFMFWACSAFDENSRGSAPYVALFFCAIVAYIVPMLHYIVSRTLVAFRELVPLLDGTPAEVAAWEHKLSHPSLRWAAGTTLLGATFGIIHNSLLIGFSEGAYRAPWSNAAQISLVIATLLVWITMTCAIAVMLSNAIAFNRLARRTRIDLLNSQQLMPFARVAVVSTLVLVGSQALYPIMLIQTRISPVTYIPGFITTSAAVLALFLLPVWPIHSRLAQAKTQSLTEISRLIATAPRSAEDPASLHQLNAWLSYRRELKQVSEWPFDVSTLARLGFYLIIPPLTWVGAALIEHLVENVL